ncbi:hypothetical protein AAFC00_001432 [Neodothiora populina]|uniref:Core domain-containing protein n=2 Tax=Neodothiora populina TaxID=2781224 RepID=A0ABR3PP46_9PEZI
MSTPNRMPRLLYGCCRYKHATGTLRQTSMYPPQTPGLTLTPLRQISTGQTLRSRTQGQGLTPAERRPFSSSTIRPTKAVVNPRKDENGNDMLIEIMPRASHRLSAISETDNNPNLALRVSVESGGCHGFQYLMSLTDTESIDKDEDTVFESEDGKSAKVIMDEPSLELLKGSKIDYTMELIGSQFKVTGIPGATSSCGCGSSFDVAA